MTDSLPTLDTLSLERDGHVLLIGLKPPHRVTPAAFAGKPDGRATEWI